MRLVGLPVRTPRSRPELEPSHPLNRLSHPGTAELHIEVKEVPTSAPFLHRAGSTELGAPSWEHGALIPTAGPWVPGKERRRNFFPRQRASNKMT